LACFVSPALSRARARRQIADQEGLDRFLHALEHGLIHVAETDGHLVRGQLADLDAALEHAVAVSDHDEVLALAHVERRGLFLHEAHGRRHPAHAHARHAVRVALGPYQAHLERRFARPEVERDVDRAAARNPHLPLFEVATDDIALVVLHDSVHAHVITARGNHPERVLALRHEAAEARPGGALLLVLRELAGSGLLLLALGLTGPARDLDREEALRALPRLVLEPHVELSPAADERGHREREQNSVGQQRARVPAQVRLGVRHARRETQDLDRVGRAARVHANLELRLGRER